MGLDVWKVFIAPSFAEFLPYDTARAIAGVEVAEAGRQISSAASRGFFQQASSSQAGTSSGSMCSTPIAADPSRVMVTALLGANDRF